MVAHAIQDRRGNSAVQLIAVLIAAISLLCLFFGKALISLILMVASLVAGLIWEKITRPPTNNAANFLIQFRSMSPPRPVLVCLGDSLTHGKVSDNWIVKIAPRVAQKMRFEPPKPGDFQDPVWVVNAGQNSITTFVVLQERLRAALACYPDYIVLMIGTNDVLSVYSPMASRDKVSTFNLPEPPSIQGFRRDLVAILDFLTKASPKTEVGVCTLPPMGENLAGPANKLIKEANEIIHSAVDTHAANGKVSLIEVGERFQSEIVSKNEGGKKALDVSLMVPLQVVQAPLHHLLGLSWKSMTGLSSGCILHDALHFNEDAGDIMADLVTEWLFQKNVHKAIAVKQF